MKCSFYRILALGLGLLITTGLGAQEFPDLDKSPLDIAYYPSRAAFRAFADSEEQKQANMPVIKVVYSRPQMNGREVFGQLVPYDKVWRAGANESTEIKFFEDVTIGGTEVPAGTYALFIEPSAEEWRIIINESTDNWGAFAYEADMDVASVTVPVETLDDPVEAFSIVFEKSEEGAHMIMAWENSLVRVPVEFE
ncbi:MAG: DUF2911 domain-containing protein [Saprospiraceae bacterium]|nr:DUF2911 domain-containing protein [Saprospiraceae bacterium]